MAYTVLLQKPYTNMTVHVGMYYFTIIVCLILVYIFKTVIIIKFIGNLLFTKIYDYFKF